MQLNKQTLVDFRAFYKFVSWQRSHTWARKICADINWPVSKCFILHYYLRTGQFLPKPFFFAMILQNIVTKGLIFVLSDLFDLQ